MRNDTDVAPGLKHVQQMNLDLVPSPAFIPRSGAPSTFGGSLVAATIGPVVGMLSATSRQVEVDLMPMETNEATPSPWLFNPIGPKQTLNLLPPISSKHINLDVSKLIEAFHSEIKSFQPPLK